MTDFQRRLAQQLAETIDKTETLQALTATLMDAKVYGQGRMLVHPDGRVQHLKMNNARW